MVRYRKGRAERKENYTSKCYKSHSDCTLLLFHKRHRQAISQSTWKMNILSRQLRDHKPHLAPHLLVFYTAAIWQSKNCVLGCWNNSWGLDIPKPKDTRTALDCASGKIILNLSFEVQSWFHFARNAHRSLAQPPSCILKWAVGFWHPENEIHWKYTFNKAYNNHTATTNYRRNTRHVLSIIFENQSFLSSSTSQGHISSILRSVLAFMRPFHKGFLSQPSSVRLTPACPSKRSFFLSE